MNPSPSAESAAGPALPSGLVLTPAEWEIVHAVLRRHVPQHEVWAFGSRTRGTAKRFADLDLAVLCGEPLPLLTLASMKEDFSDSDLPYKVDIVDWASTSEEFRKSIAAGHVVIAASQNAGARETPGPSDSRIGLRPA